VQCDGVDGVVELLVGDISVRDFLAPALRRLCRTTRSSAHPPVLVARIVEHAPDGRCLSGRLPEETFLRPGARRGVPFNRTMTPSSPEALSSAGRTSSGSRSHCLVERRRFSGSRIAGRFGLAGIPEHASTASHRERKAARPSHGNPES